MTTEASFVPSDASIAPSEASFASFDASFMASGASIATFDASIVASEASFIPSETSVMAFGASVELPPLTEFEKLVRFVAVNGSGGAAWWSRQTVNLLGERITVKNRVLRNYSEKSNGQLGEFAQHIATSLTGNANFPTPPILPAALNTQALAFNASVAKAINGTPADTLDQNNQRAALIAALDTLANYVDLIAKGNEAIIVSSGFAVASSTRTAAVPGMSAVLGVENVASTKLGLDLQTADNAWAYIVEYTAQPDGAPLLKTFTSLKEVILPALISGKIYSLRVKVMGSNNQETEWSDAVTHMAT
jgi:hypothetical protein